MYWLSGAEADKLVKSVEDAYEKVTRSGPNPLKSMDIKKVKQKINSGNARQFISVVINMFRLPEFLTG